MAFVADGWCHAGPVGAFFTDFFFCFLAESFLAESFREAFLAGATSLHGRLPFFSMWYATSSSSESNLHFLPSTFGSTNWLVPSACRGKTQQQRTPVSGKVRHGR